MTILFFPAASSRSMSAIGSIVFIISPMGWLCFFFYHFSNIVRYFLLFDKPFSSKNSEIK